MQTLSFCWTASDQLCFYLDTTLPHNALHLPSWSEARQGASFMGSVGDAYRQILAHIPSLPNQVLQAPT